MSRDGRKPVAPTLPRRISSWAKAVAEWKLAGSPERPEAEVSRIYNTICAGSPPCRWFSRTRRICRACGCRVASGGHAVFNKIKMATQHCPRNLW